MRYSHEHCTKKEGKKGRALRSWALSPAGSRAGVVGVVVRDLAGRQAEAAMRFRFDPIGHTLQPLRI